SRPMRPRGSRGRRASLPPQPSSADRQSSPVRRLLLLTSAVVFVDTLFFVALTPLLPHYAHALHLGKTGAGVLSAAYAVGSFVGVGVASLALVGWAATMPAPHRQEPQRVSSLFASLLDTRTLAGIWFVLLPALLFGVVSVLAPLRLSALGFGAVATSAVFL